MTSPHTDERRQHPRIAIPFPATVEGVSGGGEPFKADTMTDDISAGGVYLRVAELVREGSEVSITTRLSAVADRGMVVRLKGKVVRVELKAGGAYGVAVKVESRRIL